MLKNFFRVFLLVMGSCFLILVSLSQKESHSAYDGLLRQYQKAEKYYSDATAAGQAANYNEEREDRLNKLALQEYRNVLSRVPANNPVYDSIHFFSAFRTGELEHYFEEYQKALDAYRLSISIQGKSSLPDSLMFRPYLYSGIIYYNQNRFDTASLFFKKAEDIQLKYEQRLTETERLYNMLGVLSFERGDYKHAGNYFLKALELLPGTHPYYNELFINYKINLAQIYFKLEDYDRANRVYQELLLLPSNQGLLNEIYHNIGSINLYLGAANKSLYYFKKVNYQGNRKIRLYNSMGLAYLNLEKPDSARIYLDSAIGIHKNMGANSNPLAYGQALKNKGDLEMFLHQPEKALGYYQQAIHLFYPSYRENSYRSDPVEFSGLFSYINLFNTLVSKAEAFHALYLQKRSADWAQEELETYQSAFQLLAYVESTHNSDESRLFIEKSKYIVHAKPIDIAYELYQKTGDQNYLEDLYVFDQQNKASILAMQQQFAEKFTGSDSILFSRERNTRSEISRLSLKAAQNPDSGALTLIHNQIREQELELGTIRESLQKDMVASDNIPSIRELQAMLDKNTALISYHLSDSSLTTLLVRKNKLEGYQQPLFPGFHDTINTYLYQLKSPTGNTTSSTNIYQLVLGNISLNGIQRLIIIPDDDLNYLPFESLEGTDNIYLVEKCAIQYQFSTTLLKKENIDFTHHSTMAFSPFAGLPYRDSTLQLERLTHSLQEIENVKGDRFIDGNATKQNFINNLNQHKVIHLATHARVNTDEEELSFIAFSPGGKTPQQFLLYAGEIYHLPLRKTELVILSACETGTGNLVKGEGIMSLSRAFYYAGCSNIITTLWQANDFSTSYITSRIHEYLDKDYTIDIALQQARLDYLRDPSVNPRLKHPYYWSQLVFAGNYETSAPSFHWWWIALLVPVLIAAIMIIKKPGGSRLGFHRKESV